MALTLGAGAQSPSAEGSMGGDPGIIFVSEAQPNMDTTHEHLAKPPAYYSQNNSDASVMTRLIVSWLT